MTTEGIEAVFLETHNWGKSARFFQGLGYELEDGRLWDSKLPYPTRAARHGNRRKR
jgi:hypothetical protein